MTVIERDAWADARTAVTEPFLEGDLARVRRRLWLRRAGSTLLGGIVFVGPYLAWDAATGFSVDELWHLPTVVSFLGLGLAGAGVVVMGAGGVRAFWRGADDESVPPQAFLSRVDRTWLRTQVAELRPVDEERREVVADAARRMVGNGTDGVPRYVGNLLFFVGIMVATPFPPTVAGLTVLIAATIVQLVRARLWAGRARRWLARYA